MYEWEITPDWLEPVDWGWDLQCHLGKSFGNVLDVRAIMGYLYVGPLSGGYHATYDTTHMESYTRTKIPAAYYAGVEALYRKPYGTRDLRLGIELVNYWASLDITNEYESSNIVDISEREQFRFTGNGVGVNILVGGAWKLTKQVSVEVWGGYRFIQPIKV